MNNSFGAMLEHDISAVFFNDNAEFSEKHTIDGTSMDVIVDSVEQQKRGAVKVYSAETANLYKGNLLIFVSAKQFGSKPAIGRILKLDNVPRRVANCISDLGTYAIELEAIKS